MIKHFLLAGLGVLMLLSTGCNESIDESNASAKVVGWVYTDNTYATGVEGVQIIIESDPGADNPYEGPDRWFVSEANGHFEGAVFLGNQRAEGGGYNYVADVSVAYFHRGQSFSWSGGITVGPGSTFTLPAVDLTMFR